MTTDDLKKDVLRRLLTILPKEGIGFSYYSSIGLTNRPNFKKASFDLFQDKEIKVKVIYM